MPDFDVPGIGQARTNLRQLANSPHATHGSGIGSALIKELYAEIRAARIAGHSWPTITEAINSAVKIEISRATVLRLFRELDKKYEQETGVAALPIQTQKARRKKPKKEAPGMGGNG